MRSDHPDRHQGHRGRRSRARAQRWCGGIPDRPGRAASPADARASSCSSADWPRSRRRVRRRSVGSSGAEVPGGEPRRERRRISAPNQYQQPKRTALSASGRRELGHTAQRSELSSGVCEPRSNAQPSFIAVAVVATSRPRCSAVARTISRGFCAGGPPTKVGHPRMIASAPCNRSKRSECDWPRSRQSTATFARLVAPAATLDANRATWPC